MLAIHPDQVAVINDAFTPSFADVEHAKKVRSLAFANGAGVASLDGKMLDQPHLKNGRRTCLQWMKRSAVADTLFRRCRYMRACSPHYPAVENNNQGDEHGESDLVHPWEVRGNEAQRCVGGERHDQSRKDDAEQALAHDHAGGDEYGELLGIVRAIRSLRPYIVPIADERAESPPAMSPTSADRCRCPRRVAAGATIPSGRKVHRLRSGRRRAAEADEDHVPVQIAADHALCERGDQRRLRRRKRLGPGNDVNRLGAPAKPIAWARRLSTGGITAAPAMTPMISAH